ncbi:MAG TPA: 2-phospho-L-lactate guanylyltransferase [Solirubrobacteraceae bacterium]|nr:2-phospho-L-lactate guanylyltransferase [Solirubrobacteraceae bacterium]
MRTVAILPVKSYDRAKSRLAGAVVPPGGAAAFGALDRASLAAAMAERVLDALAGAERLDAVLVVTREEAARAAALARGFEVVDEPVLAGHNAAAELGITRALALGAERALLVPGDCPLLAADEVDGLLDRHPGRGVVVVPDRHRTGTNALLLCPPDAIRPAFGPGSFARHLALAGDAAVDEVPGLLLDVDTGEDLAALHEAQR